MAQQLVILNFQDASGNPLALGSVTFRLSTDISTATSGGVQIAAKRLVTVELDASGNCSVLLWPNDTLVPSGSVYFVQAYTAQGQPAWTGQITVTSGTYFLLQEDGISVFLLENSSLDAILLE